MAGSEIVPCPLHSMFRIKFPCNGGVVAQRLMKSLPTYQPELRYNLHNIKDGNPLCMRHFFHLALGWWHLGGVPSNHGSRLEEMLGLCPARGIFLGLSLQRSASCTPIYLPWQLKW